MRQIAVNGNANIAGQERGGSRVGSRAGRRMMVGRAGARARVGDKARVVSVAFIGRIYARRQ